jgi:hypothetical protein
VHCCKNENISLTARDRQNMCYIRFVRLLAAKSDSFN